MIDKSFEIARKCKYDGNQRVLASIVYKIFDKVTGSRMRVNEQLAEELHKTVIKNSKEDESMQDLKTIFGQQI